MPPAETCAALSTCFNSAQIEYRAIVYAIMLPMRESMPETPDSPPTPRPPDPTLPTPPDPGLPPSEPGPEIPSPDLPDPAPLVDPVPTLWR
jgi:hypothetical protein